MKTHRSHVLVADDDPQILKLFARILSRGGFSVTAVGSGDAAIKVLQDGPVDLLVLDLNMPPPDGFELLKSLRAKRPGLRILVISGYMQGALLKASEILGATASLSKIDAPKLLLQTVNMLLQQNG